MSWGWVASQRSKPDIRTSCLSIHFLNPNSHCADRFLGSLFVEYISTVLLLRLQIKCRGFAIDLCFYTSTLYFVLFMISSEAAQWSVMLTAPVDECMRPDCGLSAGRARQSADGQSV